MTKDEFEGLLGTALDVVGVDRTIVSVHEQPGSISVGIRGEMDPNAMEKLRRILQSNTPLGISVTVTADKLIELPSQLKLAFGTPMKKVYTINRDGFAIVDLAIPTGPAAHVVFIQAESGALFEVMTWASNEYLTLATMQEQVPCLIRCANRRRKTGYEGGDHTKTLFEGRLEAMLRWQQVEMMPGWELKGVAFQQKHLPLRRADLEHAQKQIEDANRRPPWDAQ